VRYDKLAFFCEACGKLGHGFKECGCGVFEEKELKFKKWLYADTPPHINAGGGFNARGARGGRRGSFGMGAGQVGSTGFEEEELRDTGTSLRKPNDVSMEDVNGSTMK
jgi:hypothetical protein